MNDAAPPSFAGRWRLSLERSDFGKVPGGPPKRRTDIIEVEGTRIRHSLTQVRGAQEIAAVYDYATDGSPTLNRIDGRDVRTIANGEGSELHLQSTAKLLMFTVRMDERWSLSPDGRVLTFARHVRYGIGEADQTLVFDRE